MKAEREKRAVILEAEGMRQSDITRRRRAQGGGHAGSGRAQGSGVFAHAEARDAPPRQRRLRRGW